jgi:two-component system response regulator AtoC
MVTRARRESPTAQRSLPRRFRALVVDDAESMRTYLANLLELRGYDVDTAEGGQRALALLEGGANPDVVVLDVMMPGIDGIETLKRIRALEPELPVVMLSVVGKASTIVEAMQLGAVDYLNKPFEEEELEATLAKVLEERALVHERDRLLAELDDPIDSVVWASAAMQRVHDLIEQVADTDVTVLIQGESGSGKEVVARTLHGVSTRSHRPFVKVNCAALPGNLLESELFGYEKGAFTGATARKPGKFEIAHRGTIFFDEIGEMSPPLQAKLLQVLQDGRFSRLGGNREIAVDVRVVCATHRKLDEMVREGSFREDLFFRLNVVKVFLPPLSERREEIPLLVNNFLRRGAARYRKPIPRMSDRLMKAFDEAHRRARERGDDPR